MNLAKVGPVPRYSMSVVAVYGVFDGGWIKVISKFKGKHALQKQAVKTTSHPRSAKEVQQTPTPKYLYFKSKVHCDLHRQNSYSCIV